MKLRNYQEHALAAALSSIRDNHNPVLSIPCAGGKSLIAAALCRHLTIDGGRVLIANHRKELLEQNFEALKALSSESDAATMGIYSAGLGRRDVAQQVIFGGVQSVYRRLPELLAHGSFKAVIVDEAHLVPRDTETTLYGQLFSALPHAHRIGLSATPYRMDSGMLHEGEGALFDCLAIHIKPSELVPEWLAPLVGKRAAGEIRTSGVQVRAGEFKTSELEQVAIDDALIRRAVGEIVRYGEDRRYWLIFCITETHAKAVCEEFMRRELSTWRVTRRTPPEERALIIKFFKEGQIRALVDVNVLTMGVDAPGIDLIAVLRPTLSRGLHLQMMGRGMRKAPGKRDCLILDMAGNVMRHGSLDSLVEFGETPAIRKMEAERETRARRARMIHHAALAHDVDPTTAVVRELPIDRVVYSTEASKKYPDKTNIVAVYTCGNLTIRGWVHLEYPGGAAWHAKRWFARRGIDLNRDRAYFGCNAKRAMGFIRSLKTPSTLSVSFAGSYPRILVEHFDQEDTEEERDTMD
jgi:DNA repair protein RadD